MALTPSASYSLTVRAAIKKFADVDAFPVCLATKDVDEIVQTVKHIEPVYVIPSVFNKKVASAVAREVVRAAQRSGLARRRRRPAH